MGMPLRTAHLLAALLLLAPAGAGGGGGRGLTPIDRRALVSRHDPVLRSMDVDSPLTVGNGQFAFTADVTGLQTFAEAYEQTVPLGTLSQWGWHTAPNPNGWSIDSYRFTEYESHGRKVGYADVPGDRRTPEVQWLRANPHRLHLGRIGFELRTQDGRRARPADVTAIEQSLDLWNGVLVSRFSLEGQPVEVTTICHPVLDAVAVRVQSALVGQGRIAIALAFPYGTGSMTAADWTRPDAHETLPMPRGEQAQFARRLDNDRYTVSAAWSAAGTLRSPGRHHYVVEPVGGGERFDFVAAFAPGRPARARRGNSTPSFDDTLAAARRHWNRFWSEGGAIDLSGSRDPRWREL